MAWHAGNHSVNSGNNTGWLFGDTWYAGTHSTDSGNNAGWNFTAPAKRGWTSK